MSSVAVLGGGISGLSAAYYLSRATRTSFNKIVLLEANKHLGGWVQSKRLDDGTVFELGPRSIRGVGVAGHNTLALAEDLGLQDDVIAVSRSHPSAQNRFIYAGGELCPLPSGLGSVVKAAPPFTKSLLSIGWKEPFKRSQEMEDETVYDFMKRRFNDEVAMYLSDPMCRGVFSGNAKKLSMKSCFPIMFNAEQDFGSITVGMYRRKKPQSDLDGELIKRYKDENWAMWSLQRGLQQLPEALEKYLGEQSNVSTMTDTSCQKLEFHDGKAKIMIRDRQHEASHVISTLPAFGLAKLVDDQHPELGRLLNQIPFASVAVVNLLYKGSILPMEGFGHLVPSTEKSKILGVLYESCTFPEHNSDPNTTRITCMMGGAWFEEFFGDPDQCDPDHIAKVAVEETKQQLNITEEPVRVISTVHKQCIPQYVIGHSKVLDSIWSYIDSNKLPLSLSGASYRGPSVNDCIHNTRIEVDKMVAAAS